MTAIIHALVYIVYQSVVDTIANQSTHPNIYVKNNKLKTTTLIFGQILQFKICKIH